jgi:hypothetical protein
MFSLIYIGALLFVVIASIIVLPWVINEFQWREKERFQKHGDKNHGR